MRRALFIVALTAAPAAAQPVGAPRVAIQPAIRRPPPLAAPSAVGPLGSAPAVSGPRHWAGGDAAPGGRDAYRRPVYGWRLPHYWIAPDFFIADFGRYGLGAPAPGYGWSRYYDDAVLTDQWGRVYDVRSDIDWDGGYHDVPPPDDDRDELRRAHRHHHRDGNAYSYRGQWTGHWDGQATRTFSGEWHGTVRPHWADAGRPPVRPEYGYGGGETVVTTVIVQPSVVTRTVSYETVTARTTPKRRWKARPRCVCGS